MANTLKKYIDIVVGADVKGAIDGYNRIESENRELGQSYEKMVDGVQGESRDYSDSMKKIERDTKMSLDKTESRFQRFRKSISGLGSNISAGLAIGGIVAFSKAAIGAFTEQEKSAKLLENVIRSTGGAAGLAAGEISAMAEELQNLTNFGDEATEMAAAQLLTFTKIRKEIFPEVLEAAMNVSELYGTDLKSSIIQVGKAVNDTEQGISALSRSGITFSEEQKKQIKILNEAGDTLGAQKIILKELEVQFGGTARAAAETFGGKIKGLQNTYSDFLEKLGRAISENDAFSMSLDGLKELFGDPAFIKSISDIVSGIASFTSGILNATFAIPQLINQGDALRAQTKDMGEDFASSFDRSIAALRAAGLESDEFWSKLKETDPGKNLEILEGNVVSLKDTIKKLGDEMGDMPMELMDAQLVALEGKTKELEEAETELVRVRAASAQALIIEAEKYGISKEIQEKARDILTGTLKEKEKEIAARNKNADAIKKETKAILDFGEPLDNLTESLDEFDRAFDFKFDTGQLEGVSDLIDEVSGVMEEGEQSLAAYNAEVERQKASFDAASGALEDHAGLAARINKVYGAGIPILSDSEKIRKKLIDAVTKTAKISEAEAAAVVDNYLAWQKWRETIISALYVLSDAVGAIGKFIGISEGAAKAVSGLASGFARMASGDFIGGAIGILSDAESILGGIADALTSGTEPALSFADATKQASDMMENFGVRGDEANTMLALFLQQVAEGNRELDDFSSFVADTTHNMDNLDKSFWGAYLGLDALGDSASEFEKLMRQVNGTVGDIADELRDVSGLEDIFAGGAGGANQLDNQIEMLRDRLGQMLQAGIPLSEAMELLDGSFNLLSDSADKLGEKGSKAFQDLLEYRDLLAKNEETINAIEGIGKELETAFDIGRFDKEGGQKAFQGFIEEALSNFKELERAGFEPGQALQTMGPVLTQIQDMAKELGFTLGDDITNLIGAADKAGVLAEIDPLETVADTLERIANILSGAFPAAAQAAADSLGSVQAAADSLGNINGPSINMPIAPNMQGLSNIGMSGGGTTTTNQQKTVNVYIQSGAIGGVSVTADTTLDGRELVEAIQRNQNGIIEAVNRQLKTIGAI